MWSTCFSRICAVFWRASRCKTRWTPPWATPKKARNSSPPRPRKGRRALGVPAQKRIGFGRVGARNMGFGLTILAPGALQKPGNPPGLPGFFHTLARPKRPGRLTAYGRFWAQTTPCVWHKAGTARPPAPPAKRPPAPAQGTQATTGPRPRLRLCPRPRRSAGCRLLR